MHRIALDFEDCLAGKWREGEVRCIARDIDDGAGPATVLSVYITIGYVGR